MASDTVRASPIQNHDVSCIVFSVQSISIKNRTEVKELRSQYILSVLCLIFRTVLGAILI
jgi:hypothetical protein